MSANKIVRIITAIPLGIAAFMFLLFVPNAHVTMCMACAIGYSMGLPMDKYENTLNRIVSFLSGGILFYTIYAGTTLLFIEWFSDVGNWGSPEGPLYLDPAWIYHTLINIAILVLFITKKDRIEYVLWGMEIFMIGAPVMLLIQRLLGRELWGDESRIVVYVILGFVLLILHRLVVTLLPQDTATKIFLGVRKLIMVSLVVYTVLLIVAAVVAPTPGGSVYGEITFW